MAFSVLALMRKFEQFGRYAVIYRHLADCIAAFSIMLLFSSV